MASASGPVIEAIKRPADAGDRCTLLKQTIARFPNARGAIVVKCQREAALTTCQLRLRNMPVLNVFDWTENYQKEAWSSKKFQVSKGV